ncbi:MAG TPA: biotin/lipoyl-binding protein [Planctomycetes bacterium]|nr:biotin/lipoyl-binding protein [Planctomycetaceae bacterium]HIM29649.1 biotin/lipoyl-binding protein [Planctomycetota bacterium]
MQFAGFVTAGKTVRIQSRIDSVVTDVFFKEGDFVERGTLLFLLDPTLHRLHVDLVRERLVAIKTEMEAKTNQLMQFHRIREKTAAFQDRLNAASATLNELKTERRIAEIELKLAEAELSFTQIVAPFSGRLGRIELTQGSLVTTARPCPV